MERRAILWLAGQGLVEPGVLERELEARKDDEGTGRLLRSLFERRNEADHAPVEVPLEAAEAAIGDADRVVRAVDAWLRRRASPRATPPGAGP